MRVECDGTGGNLRLLAGEEERRANRAANRIAAGVWAVLAGAYPFYAAFAADAVFTPIWGAGYALIAGVGAALFFMEDIEEIRVGPGLAVEKRRAWRSGRRSHEIPHPPHLEVRFDPEVWILDMRDGRRGKLVARGKLDGLEDPSEAEDLILRIGGALGYERYRGPDVRSEGVAYRFGPGEALPLIVPAGRPNFATETIADPDPLKRSAGRSIDAGRLEDRIEESPPTDFLLERRARRGRVAAGLGMAALAVLWTILLLAIGMNWGRKILLSYLALASAAGARTFLADSLRRRIRLEASAGLLHLGARRYPLDGITGVELSETTVRDGASPANRGTLALLLPGGGSIPIARTRPRSGARGAAEALTPLGARMALAAARPLHGSWSRNP